MSPGEPLVSTTFGLRQLRYFVVAAEEGQITRAAHAVQRLGLAAAQGNPRAPGVAGVGKVVQHLTASVIRQSAIEQKPGEVIDKCFGRIKLIGINHALEINLWLTRSGDGAAHKEQIKIIEPRHPGAAPDVLALHDHQCDLPVGFRLRFGKPAWPQDAGALV